MDFKEINTTKLYKVFINSTIDCAFIIGRTQEGNDNILHHATAIFESTLKDIKIDHDKLIWIHGNGPSPHFIFWIDPVCQINVGEIEAITKSMMPKKSLLDAPLMSCFLKDVKLTNTKGLVTVNGIKLNKLLQNIKK